MAESNPELDDAVRRIVELMLRDEWEPGASHLSFAEEFGVRVATVRDWASHASRFIRLCAGSDEEIRDELLRNIRRIGGKAEAAADHRNALAAQELRLRVHGFLERKQAVNEPPPMTDEEAWAEIRTLQKETDATERVTETAAGRSDPDSEGAAREREEKGREEGFRSDED